MTTVIFRLRITLKSVSGLLYLVQRQEKATSPLVRALRAVANVAHS